MSECLCPLTIGVSQPRLTAEVGVWKGIWSCRPWCVNVAGAPWERLRVHLPLLVGEGILKTPSLGTVNSPPPWAGNFQSSGIYVVYEPSGLKHFVITDPHTETETCPKREACWKVRSHRESVALPHLHCWYLSDVRCSPYPKPCVVGASKCCQSKEVGGLSKTNCWARDFRIEDSLSRLLEMLLVSVLAMSLLQ